VTAGSAGAVNLPHGAQKRRGSDARTVSSGALKPRREARSGPFAGLPAGVRVDPAHPADVCCGRRVVSQLQGTAHYEVASLLAAVTSGDTDLANWPAAHLRQELFRDRPGQSEASPASLTDETRVAAGRPASWLVLAVILAATAARLAFAGGVGLEQDGAHSAEMARHFAWGYFDHPPLHYWLIGLAERLTGSTAPIILRLPFILLGAGSTWLMFRLTAFAFGERAGLWAVLGFSVCLDFTVFVPVMVAPDGPLVFFLLLTALILARIVLAERELQSPNLWWAAAGAAGGAALLSKYSAVFLFAGAFLYLVTTRSQRRWLATPGPWLGVAVAIVMFSPVIYWNWQHDWASFAFQASRGLPSDTGGVHFLIGSILGQAGYLFPLFFPVLAFELIRACAAGPSEPRSWFFACLAVLPIVVFTTLNLLQRGLPHWPMPGWLFAMPLLGATVTRLTGGRLRLARYAVATSAAVTVIAAGAVVAYVQTGIFDRWAPLVLRPKPYAGNELLWSFVDWAALRPAMTDAGFFGKDVQFLAGLNWATYSRLDLAFGRDTPLLCLCSPRSRLRVPTDPGVFAGATGIILGLPNTFDDNARLIARSFARVEELPPVRLVRGGTVVLEFRAARGIGFKPDAGTGETGRPDGRPRGQ